MRRWVCIVALLAGFTAADDYVRAARLRQPVAIERLIDPHDLAGRGRTGERTRGLTPTGAWWSRFRG